MYWFDTTYEWVYFMEAQGSLRDLSTLLEQTAWDCMHWKGQIEQLPSIHVGH